MVLVSATQSKVLHHDGPSRRVDERSPFSFSECSTFSALRQTSFGNRFLFFRWLLRSSFLCLMLISFATCACAFAIDWLWVDHLESNFHFRFVIIIFRTTATWLLLLSLMLLNLLGSWVFIPSDLLRTTTTGLFRAECLLVRWIWSLLIRTSTSLYFLYY